MANVTELNWYWDQGCPPEVCGAWMAVVPGFGDYTYVKGFGMTFVSDDGLTVRKWPDYYGNDYDAVARADVVTYLHV